MSVFQTSVGTLVEIPFTVYEEDGITPEVGLVDSDFGKLLALGPEEKPNPIVVVELGAEPGTYVASFTPDEKGTWYLRLTTPDEQVFVSYVEAEVEVPVVVGKGVLCA